MIITYEGRQYTYDMDDLDVEQALKIEEHIGGPISEYEQGVVVGNVKCVQALGWLILHGGDQKVPIAGLNFKFNKLMKGFLEAVEKKAAEEEKAAAARDAVDPPPPPNGNGDASTPARSRRGSLTA